MLKLVVRCWRHLVFASAVVAVNGAVISAGLWLDAPPAPTVVYGAYGYAGGAAVYSVTVRVPVYAPPPE